MQEEMARDGEESAGVAQLPSRMCAQCRHLHLPWVIVEAPQSPLPDHIEWTTYTCDAFPEGIPLPIQWGEVEHRAHYPGDHGLTYEPRFDLLDALP